MRFCALLELIVGQGTWLHLTILHYSSLVSLLSLTLFLHILRAIVIFSDLNLHKIEQIIIILLPYN